MDPIQLQNMPPLLFPRISLWISKEKRLIIFVIRDAAKESQRGWWLLSDKRFYQRCESSIPRYFGFIDINVVSLDLGNFIVACLTISPTRLLSDSMFNRDQQRWSPKKFGRFMHIILKTCIILACPKGLIDVKVSILYLCLEYYDFP